MTIRLPAEWEAQDGVLLAWPHEESDWRPYLAEVEPVFIEIVRQVSRFELAVIVAPDPAKVSNRLREAGITTDRIRLYQIDTNDTWARDFGPVTVLENNSPVLLDFGFNGWGLKFRSDMDNLINRRLLAARVWQKPLRTMGLILEGGSIESDGTGTILTTAECLLNGNRNPHLDRTGIENACMQMFGADRVLWLEHGFLSGDDTDSHIDTLARLCPADTIVYTACDDPADEHFLELHEMAKELRSFATREGKPYRLLPLPWPQPCYDQDGERLPATYANFLIINDAVLVPTYRDRNDANALHIIGSAFPGREIIPIDCHPLILQHGSLHCVTMQLPQGTICT